MSNLKIQVGAKVPPPTFRRP